MESEGGGGGGTQKCKAITFWGHSKWEPQMLGWETIPPPHSLPTRALPSVSPPSPPPPPLPLLALPTPNPLRFLAGLSVVQWHPFSLFVGGCPTKNGLPQKVFSFFPGSLGNWSKTPSSPPSPPPHPPRFSWLPAWQVSVAMVPPLPSPAGVSRLPFSAGLSGHGQQVQLGGRHLGRLRPARHGGHRGGHLHRDLRTGRRPHLFRPSPVKKGQWGAGGLFLCLIDLT